MQKTTKQKYEIDYDYDGFEYLVGQQKWEES